MSETTMLRLIVAGLCALAMLLGTLLAWKGKDARHLWLVASACVGFLAGQSAS